jgi:hypothetical protein
MPVNPSYLGGRYQEDQGSRPAQKRARSYLKITQHKVKELAEWLQKERACKTSLASMRS